MSKLSAEFGHSGRSFTRCAVAQAQRLPAILPCAAGTGRAVEHDEIVVGAELEPAQVIGHGQPGLSCTDHHDLGAFGAVIT